MSQWHANLNVMNTLSIRFQWVVLNKTLYLEYLEVLEIQLK